VRANIVVVPGVHGPVRVSTSCADGPAGWTCANCGYTDPCGGEIEGRLERVPERATRQPAMVPELTEGRASDGESGPVPRRGNSLPRGPHPEPDGVGGNDRLVGVVSGAVGRPTEADQVLRVARRAPAPDELSIHDLIVRIRWERAKREALVPGTAVHLAVGVTEARLIRELHHRFGVENITASDLEWYVRVDHGRGHRERAEPA